MSTLFITNIAIEIVCSVLSFVFVVCIFVSDGLKVRLSRLFICVLLSNAAVMLSDALAFYSIGKAGTVFRVLNFIGNFCTFQFSYILVMCFSNYLITYLSAKIPMKRTAVHLIYGICGTAILLTFLSLLNGMYFTIDENNIYHRQGMYWLSQLLGGLGMLVNATVIIRYHRHFNRLERLALTSYVVLPIIAIIVQTSVYGYVSVYIASTLTILFIYVGMQVQYSKMLKEKELLLTESRIDVMLSQIQPHFLYNTLTTIETLCHEDSNTAAKLVRDFSGYLRENMDSLTQKELVSFEREIGHVQVYLDIEKQRFEERLNIVYDFEVTDFKLPILTVQPLVENAVRYGVTKNKEGGTVSISTRREPGCVKIIICDDGAGFDTSKSNKDGRSHVGIENVRERLRLRCSGSLTVESEKGKGTVCTITIPINGGSPYESDNSG